MYLYSAHFCSTRKALRHGSHNVTCNCTSACLYLVCVHQMAPPRLRLRTSNCSLLLIYQPERMKGCVGLVAWPTADGLPTKWSPVSYRSSAGQGKFAGQRPTFYHCTTFRAFRPATANRRSPNWSRDRGISYWSLDADLMPEHDSIPKVANIQSGAEKVDHHAVCEHNLRKVLLNSGFIFVKYRCQR